jgi:hypothetical protein
MPAHGAGDLAYLGSVAAPTIGAVRRRAALSLGAWKVVLVDAAGGHDPLHALRAVQLAVVGVFVAGARGERQRSVA